MGLNLRALLNPAMVSHRDLAGETVAVDAYGMLYQFLTTLRDARGELLTDRHGNTISHLIGLVSKTQELLSAGIRPVYVFDGPPHPLKMQTLKKRAESKDAARLKLIEAIEARDRDAIRRLSGQTTYVTDEMVASATTLLGSCGLPYVMAPQDGEAQCAALVATGAVDAAASQDYDTLVYGAPRVLRNLTSTKRETEEVLLASLEIDHGLDRDRLVDLALLVGNDFHDGVKGVGPAGAVRVLKAHGSLAAFFDKCDKAYVPKNAAEKRVAAAVDELRSDMAEKVRELFLRPHVLDDLALAPGNPDATTIHERLVEVHGFSKGRADTFATTVVTHFERFQTASRRPVQTRLAG